MSNVNSSATVRIDPAEWFRLKQRLDEVDKGLVRALRKRIRNAGKIAADAVIESLRENPPPGVADPEGMRAALQAQTKVALSFTPRGAGVKVRTSNRSLPESDKRMVFAYNRKVFRHPVFADDAQPRTAWKWVPQPGRPYFGASITPLLDGEIEKEVRSALDDALAAIDGRVRGRFR